MTADNNGNNKVDPLSALDDVFFRCNVAVLHTGAAMV